ncbi:MAG: hypothetical protein LBH98_04275 [Chitinispirillales bacterium]|jgi:hypothetical protein|nr:hypothetical protein [Chitinispirillales bacterium]
MIYSAQGNRVLVMYNDHRIDGFSKEGDAVTIEPLSDPITTKELVGGHVLRVSAGSSLSYRVTIKLAKGVPSDRALRDEFKRELSEVGGLFPEKQLTITDLSSGFRFSAGTAYIEKGGNFSSDLNSDVEWVFVCAGVEL